jgi:hypothetical protein
MKKIALSLLFTNVFMLSYAQDSAKDERKTNQFCMGVGYGFDYGGIGGHLIYYPQKNIGIFGGIGYAFAGLGYNVGLKLRLLPRKENTKASPFIVGMYGYNVAVAVADNNQYNKFFYGPTLGLGVDLGSQMRRRGGYVSLAIMFPIRNGDAQNYMDQLTSNNGVVFKNKLSSVGFSIGYKINVD